MESMVGYVAAEDVYVVYREYYGDGTIYGRVDLLLNGEPVRGAGKSKKELVEAGVVLSENFIGSVGGDLVGVPDSNEVVAEVAPEVAAPCVCSCSSVCACACSCPPECACVVPAAEPVEVAPEAEALPEAEVAPEVAAELPCSGRYTVSMVIAGFTVSRELNVKINEESRQLYLSE
jgi:hypothetical protein